MKKALEILSRNVGYIKGRFFKNDGSAADDELSMSIDAMREAVKEIAEALLQHRADLHQRSNRPCPTCRKSAEVLGIKVPNECAKKEWDDQALKGKS